MGNNNNVNKNTKYATLFVTLIIITMIISVSRAIPIYIGIPLLLIFIGFESFFISKATKAKKKGD